MEETFARANANAEAVAAGRTPDLSPLRTAPPVELHHVAGPPLRRPVSSWRRQRGRRPAAAGRRRPTRAGVRGRRRAVGRERARLRAGGAPVRARCTCTARCVGEAAPAGRGRPRAAAGGRPGRVRRGAAGRRRAGRRRCWPAGWPRPPAAAASWWTRPGSTPAMSPSWPRCSRRRASSTSCATCEARCGRWPTRRWARRRHRRHPGAGTAARAGGRGARRSSAGSSRSSGLRRRQPRRRGRPLADDHPRRPASRDPETVVGRCLEFLGEPTARRVHAPAARSCAALATPGPLGRRSRRRAWWSGRWRCPERLAPVPPIATAGDGDRPLPEGVRDVLRAASSRACATAAGTCTWSASARTRSTGRSSPSCASGSRRTERLHVARDDVDAADRGAARPTSSTSATACSPATACTSREALGCRIVVSFRGFDLNSFRLDEDGAYDDVWRGADMVHAVSHQLWARAIERGCPHDRAHMRHPRRGRRRAPARRPTRADRATSARAERPLRLLSVGRLHWKKGHELALAAAAQLRDRGIEVEYRIVGDGEHREPTEFADRRPRAGRPRAAAGRAGRGRRCATCWPGPTCSSTRR